MTTATEAAPAPSSAVRPHLRLGQLLALAAAGPVLVVIVAVVVGLITITRQHSVQSELLNQVEPANAAVQQLEIAMLNQETGIRGFELTGDAAFLAPYTTGLAPARVNEAGVRHLHVPGTMPALDAALSRIRVWETRTVAPTLARDSHARHPRNRLDTSLQAKAQFDAVRGSLGALEDLLLRRVQTVKNELRHSSRTTEVAFSAVGIALLVSVLLAGLLMRRFVTRPIGYLADSARRVAAGDLSRRLTMTGPRDLERLGEDVDAMRARLLEELTAAREMEHQLSDAAVELRRSNAELEQFAYVASHDLQEPLRKVASFCQLLQERYHGQLDERADQFIDFAVDGAKRMQQLINDLLAFSRVGRRDQPLTEVSLDELVSAAVSDLSGVIGESGAEVSVGELPTLAVEPALMRTVFQNLIANAVKFRGQATPRVRIEARHEDTDWLFSCTDNGIGIDPEYSERIFVIFQRLHTREAYPGTGIGLAMCRKIVEHHGGRMWLDESHSDGTRMCFTLPDTPTPPSAGRLAP
ncbi:MAG TPA: ATP-binding protein [Solirubrobacteraceae bacterium]|nr:ATP-binding protein [Solirubrobacteraceae bacterium]